MARKDLPNPSAPNFLQRVREEIHALLGKTGSASERALTLRDAINSGVIGLGPGGSLVPGPGVDSEYETDLTPPPQPGAFTLTGAISHYLIEQAQPFYTQGHGHLRTHVYAASHTAGDPLPVFTDAVPVAQFDGTIYAVPSNPATTWRVWIKWESVDGVQSATPAGGTNGQAVTTGQDVATLVTAMTGPGNPFTVLEVETVIDGVTFPAGTYSTRAFIQDAQISNAKIANLAVDNAKIANLSVSKLTAGSIAVGRYAQSTGYVAGSSGWRINGDGTAEFSGVVVRGTIFASQGAIGGWTIGSNYLQSTTYALGTSGTRFNSDGTGQIGGITIYAQGLGAGSTAYDTGNGAWIGRDGKFSLKSATNSLKWNGTNLTINGGGTFSGALSAATGTFAGSLSAATGTFSGELSAATGTFSGSLTADAVNAVNTINLAGNAVTVPGSATSTTNIGTSGSQVVVLSFTLDSAGAPVWIIATGVAPTNTTGGSGASTTSYAKCSINVNGSIVATVGAPGAFAISRQVSGGVLTIELVTQYTVISGTSGGTPVVSAGATLFAIGTKR